MNLGMLFFVIALLFFFADGIGLTTAPRLMIWGLFSLTLGLLLAGVAIPFGR